MARLICSCGGQIRQPVPPTCPHCGRVIRGVRHPWGAVIGRLAVVAIFFGILVLGLLLMVAWFGGQ